MDINLALGIVSLFIGILFPTLSQLTIKSATKVKVEQAKKESATTFARLISENKVKLDPERIREYIKSKERQQELKYSLSKTHSLSKTSTIIEIFEDIEREFMENFYIPNDVKENSIKEVNRIKTEIIKNKKIERKETYPSYIVSVLIFIVIPSILILIGLAFTGDFILKYFNIALPIEPIGTLTAIVGVLIGSVIVYVTSLKEEHQEEKYQLPIFEDIVYSALIHYFGEEKIEREFQERGKIVDYIIKSEYGLVPVEVKYGDITLKSIKIYNEIKEQLKSKKALLITNSFVTDNAKLYARTHNIILIENINTEDDLKKNLLNIIAQFKEEQK